MRSFQLLLREDSFNYCLTKKYPKSVKNRGWPKLRKNWFNLSHVIEDLLFRSETVSMNLKFPSGVAQRATFWHFIFKDAVWMKVMPTFAI